MDLHSFPLKTIDSRMPSQLSTDEQQAVLETSLVSAELCASIGQVSVSWWTRECRAGRGPAPAIQRRKFTRWRLIDALTFWQNIHTYRAG